MKKPAQGYQGKQVIVRYDPKICIHSRVCVRGLPGVFDVNKRPWVNAEGADAEAIIGIIERCSSGALTYERL